MSTIIIDKKIMMEEIRSLISEGYTVEIEDSEVPQVDAPEADEEIIEDEEVPLAEPDEEKVVEEEEIPLTDVPKTSDSNNLMLWLTLAVISAMALLGMRVAEEKRR